jgi:hypothetical protein
MSTDLARRADACKHWRWMPGMLVRYGDGKSWYRLTDGDGYGMPFKHVPPNPRDAWPDWTDPATLGCLLALVRSAWGDPFGCMEAFPQPPAETTWVFGVHHGQRLLHFSGDTEAEALVAALEAAP